MRAKRQYQYEPDYAVPPGDTLHEVMVSLGMTQKELAERTGITEQSLNRIFKGDQPVSYQTANRLELVTKVPARFWNNLEARYRGQLAKLEERKRLENEKEWLKAIPTKELIDRGLIKPLHDEVDLLRETLGFFGVGTVDAWREIWDVPAVAARRSQCFETRPIPASAWIRQGELQAQQIGGIRFLSCQDPHSPANANYLKTGLGFDRITPVGVILSYTVQICNFRIKLSS